MRQRFFTQYLSIVKFLFYVLVFTLPFETLLVSNRFITDPELETAIGSLSRIPALFLMIASIPLVFEIVKTINRAVLLFIIYDLIYLVSLLYQSFHFGLPLTINHFTLPWLILNFIVYQHILTKHSLLSPSLVILLVGIGIVSILQLSNLSAARTIEFYAYDEYYQRLSAFQEDPNIMGGHYAIGVLLSYAYLTQIIHSKRIIQIIASIFLVTCSIALIQTGSRGAILCLFIAMGIYTLSPQPNRKKFVIIGFLFILFTLFIVLIQSNPGFYYRFEQFFIYQDTANRQAIYQSSIRLARDELIFGYTPIRNSYYLGQLINKTSADTHNTFLWVLTANGLIGFLPFATGVFLILRNGFRHRYGKYNIVPFVLAMFVFLMGQTISFHTEKLFWLMLAYSSLEDRKQ